VQTLAVPLTIAFSTLVFNHLANERSLGEKGAADERALREKEAADERAVYESRTKLYVELLNKREESASNLRSNIFAKLLEKYLDPTKASVVQRITVLDLLAQNFNESLNLSPLFWQLERQIRDEPFGRRSALQEQLRRIAYEIKARQADIFDAYGQKRRRSVEFASLPVVLFDEDIVLEHRNKVERLGCHFTVEVTEHDAKQQRIFVRLMVAPIDGGRKPSEFTCDVSADNKTRQWTFSVDQFDLPLVNFTRMSKSTRFAVFFDDYSSSAASVTLLFFPSSLGGVQDKPYIDDVMNELRRPSK